MAHGLSWVLRRDFQRGWERWQQDLERLPVPRSPAWKRTLGLLHTIAEPRYFSAYAAALCIMGLGAGAWAQRSGRLEPVLARWFVVVSLFAAGFLLEQQWPAVVPYGTPDWPVALVMLWVLALWPAVAGAVRIALAVFAGFVTLAQAQADGGIQPVLEGALIAVALTLILRAALQGLWRLALWRLR